MVVGKLLGGALGALAALSGVLMVRSGYTMRRKAKEMAGTEPMAIADIDPDSEGRVEVKATVSENPADTIDASIADSEGVLVHTEIEHWNTTGETNSWQTVNETVQSRPFLVEDGTGTALVEVPADADVTVEADGQDAVGVEERPSEEVRAYIERTDGVETREDRKRRYTQGVIEPGEDVYLLAEPIERAPAGSGAEITLGGEDEPDRVVVSDKSEEELVGGRASRGLMLYGVGSILLLAGLSFVSFLLIASG